MGVFSSKPATVAPVNWGTKPQNSSKNISSLCPALDSKEAEIINKERACITRKLGQNSNPKNAYNKVKQDCLEEAITGLRSSTYNGSGGGKRKKRVTCKRRRRL